MGEVVEFPVPHNGNGALEAVEYYMREIYPGRVMARANGLGPPMDDADHMLLWLAAEGFLLVSMDDLLDEEASGDPE